MAIFDGIGSILPAPEDKGLHDDKRKDIPLVPLPKSLVRPRELNEIPTLPEDKGITDIDKNSIKIESEDDVSFPDSKSPIVGIKEEITLPKGTIISVEVDNVFMPKDSIVGTIDDIGDSKPSGDAIVNIDDSAIKMKPSYVVPIVNDVIPKLPKDANVNAKLAATDLVSAPDDVTKYTTDTDNSQLNEGVVLSPEGINYSDTIIDRLFTNVTSFLDFIRVPVPKSVVSLYSKIQEIEGYLDDPKTFAIQIRDNLVGYLLGSNKDDPFNPKIGLVRPPENSLSTINYPIGIASNAEIDRNNEIEGRYAGQSTLTEGYVNKERSKQISDDILESQFSFQGRKSTVGVTLRSNHLWDLRFSPYNNASLGIECVLPVMHIKISTAYKNADSHASSESYREKYTDSKGNQKYLGETQVSDWEDSLPVLSYDLDYLSLASRDVELYGGSSISIPDIIRKNSMLSIQVLDDENKRWRRWFQRAIDKICPPSSKAASGSSNGSVVVPYKNCCMKATLYQYRTDNHILSHKEFIVLLKNYQVTSSGAGGGAGTPDVIDVEWSIVGEINKVKQPKENKYKNRSDRNTKYKKDTSIDAIEREENKSYSGKYINIV